MQFIEQHGLGMVCQVILKGLDEDLIESREDECGNVNYSGGDGKNQMQPM